MLPKRWITLTIPIPTDMEHEEERGCGGKEKAEDQRRANPGTERCVSLASN
jgi:hypothetical protein